ncbi:ShlB/FhaC/HecB family hemolysin secretion/activation protein [Azospirillum sp. TSO22-1]|uniref:ShlB/FhaC/HecB family hemolysin secretion/activation protein n=1 Tax=Azospirillum sp. TSO22-1 TaxID=716789 RepID=UPI00200054A4|nr:ShlB/FhaC/HecB family hemolysin secretion/activation protein [Azospirillum sp. TSO22-1]
MSAPISAWAQSLPGPLDPNRLEQRFDQPPTPQSVPEPELPAPEQAPPPKDAEGIRFTLSSIELDGATVYAADELRPLWEGLLNRTVTLAEVYGVRDAITAKYRNDGYVLSQAVVPAQRIRGGVVRLQVVEGYINEVTVQGDFADHAGILQGMAAKIKASRPLRMDDMERYVLLADDLPGVTVRTVLEPAEGVPGASNLTFNLERKAYSGSLSLDNRGTRSVGVLQLSGSVTADDQLGRFDRTAVTGSIAQQIRELRFLDATHTEILDSEGTTAQLGLRRSWAEPGDNVRTLEIDSLTSSLRLAVAHPFLRSRSETLRGELAFTVRNSRTNILQRRQSEDRLRVLSGTATYDIADSWDGSNLVQATLSQGLNVLEATKRGTAAARSRIGGRSDFTKLGLIVQRDQKLSEEFALVLAGEGQYAGHELLSSEEFGVGGKSYGRAFDASEITGDSGFSTRAEFQYAVPPWQEWLTYAQVYVFSDYGSVWNYESGSRHGRQSLASAGAGVRFGLLERLDATVEIAKPFMRNPFTTQDRGVRAFFTLGTRF